MKSGHLFPGHIRGVEGGGRSSTSDLEGINLRCINARGPIRLTSLLRPPPVFLFLAAALLVLAAAVAPWSSATAAPPLALNKPVVPSVFYDYSADEFTWSIEAVTGAIQYHWVQASSTRNPLTHLPTWTFTDSTAGTYTVKVAGVETGVGGVIVGPYSDSTSFIVLSPDPKAAAPTLALNGDNLTISGYAYQGATGYRIEITYPDSVPIVLTTTTDPAQTGLTDEGIYGVKVQAETSNHRTAYSNSSSVSTVPAPAKPTGLTATAGIESVTLGWDDPSDSTIKGYQYLYTTDDGTNSGVVDIPDSAPGEDNATSYTVTGLTSGLLHTIFLRPVGSGGYSPPSDSVTATPEAIGSWTHEMALDPTMITVGAGIGAVPTYRATFHVDSDQVSSVASLSAETTAGELGLSLDDGVEGSVVVGLVDGAAADPNVAEMADSKLFSGPPPRIVLQT